jgi:hypothetical protein
MAPVSQGSFVCIQHQESSPAKLLGDSCFTTSEIHHLPELLAAAKDKVVTTLRVYLFVLCFDPLEAEQKKTFALLGDGHDFWKHCRS